MSNAVIVGTWNLENLFRPGSDDGPDEQAYEAKLTQLARVISEIGFDVLGVQEVGDPEALEDLGEHLDGDWHSETSEFPDGRGIRNGFLSRLALAQVEQVREFPERLAPVQVDDEGATLAEMGRGALRVRVRAEGARRRPRQLPPEVEAADLSRGPLSALRRGRTRALRRLRPLSASLGGGHRARLRRRAARRGGPRARSDRAR